MRIRVFITVLLAILLVIFSIQNSEIVVVKLVFWNFNIPRALLILISFCMGVLLGVLIPVKNIKKDKEQDSL